jgi:hypothetical protein
MNDRDWLKRRRRGPGGGCASVMGIAVIGLLGSVWVRWAGVSLGLGALGCAGASSEGAPAQSAPVLAPAPAPPPAEVVLPDRLPVPLPPGAPTRCLVGEPGRLTVEGSGKRGDGGPVDAILAHPQARVRPDLQGRTALPLLSLVGDLSPGDQVRVTGCDGAEVSVEVTQLSPWDAVVLVDDRAGGLDLQDAREVEPMLRGVSWISRPPG